MAKPLPDNGEEVAALLHNLSEIADFVARLTASLRPGVTSPPVACPDLSPDPDPSSSGARFRIASIQKSQNEQVRSFASAVVPLLDYFALDERDRQALQDLSLTDHYFEDVNVYAQAQDGAEARNAQRQRQLIRLLGLLSVQQLQQDLAEKLTRHLALASSTDATGPHHDDQATNLKRPSDFAIKAYRLKMLGGKRTQKEIAEILTQELGRKVHQGQVSRWLEEAARWIEAGNVFPDMPPVTRSRPMPIDPERLDLGRQQENRTHRQRPKRSDDE